MPQLTADEEALRDQFIHHLRSRRRATTTLRLRTYWAHHFLAWCRASDLDPAQATAHDLDGFVFSNPDWSTSTQSTIVSTLRAFYNWAVVVGLVDKDPTGDLEPIRVRRNPARIATDEEIVTGLMNATTATERAILRLGAECGLRVHEIAGLPVSARQDRWLTINGKGGVIRSVYCSPELVADLEEIERTSARWGYYFPGKSGSHRTSSTLWRLVRRLCGVNPHSLRHRAGTTVYQRTGKDIRLTQTFLGHASPNTTAIYVHVERDDIMRAATAARIDTRLPTTIRHIDTAPSRRSPEVA